MPAYKDAKTNKWFAQFYSKNWQGVNKLVKKRGFATKRDALEYERSYKVRESANLDMNFADFYKLYEEDMKPRLKRNTWLTKEHIVRTKIMPYFEHKKMNEIKAADVVKWQNEMLTTLDEYGRHHSQTYHKTMHNQLSAIFNHAVRFYELKENPARKAGSIGNEKGKEMLFWTQEEYLRFAEVMKDKPKSYYAFEILYWCGVRVGELLALTAEDFDFKNKTLRINKSYQRLESKDIITEPKTPKSNRIIVMPDTVCEEIKEYIGMLYGFLPTDRIFHITKSFLHHEMDRGAKRAGVTRIRIHDLRHSHISLLIEMGYSAVAIASRVGHESINITYRYAHMFPSKQTEMAGNLDRIRKEVEKKGDVETEEAEEEVNGNVTESA